MDPGLFFSFTIIFTDGRTPWASDQLVARPLPKYRTTQTQNKHIHTLNIHALCEIRTHDPSFRASEDSSCLRPLSYCDRQYCSLPTHELDKAVWCNNNLYISFTKKNEYISKYCYIWVSEVAGQLWVTFLERADACLGPTLSPVQLVLRGSLSRCKVATEWSWPLSTI
jgi:hypothetical protein